MSKQRLKFLALVVQLAISGAAQAEDFTYTTNVDNAITITTYTGPGGAVEIPSVINSLPVTSIGEYAFAGSGVTSVTLPNSMTNIAEAGFYYCARLTNIMIADSIITIGRIAFTGCTSLRYVTIPQSVIGFGDGAFSFCTSLTNVTLANGLTSMGDGMFANCTDLTSVSLPNSVTNMGYGTFANCSNLTSITIPNNIRNIGDTVFGNCTRLVNITIPKGVTRIGDSTFAGCMNLKGVFFAGDSPRIVGSYVFHDDPNVIVYYLPGTTGWGPTFAGRPTAQWLLPHPTILNFEPNLGMQTNSFGFTISWATNMSVVVEACTNLSNPDWRPVQTNTLMSGTAYFTDSQWTNRLERFYRVRLP